jgi:tRNA U38,U39,U40 pseudouridine synthase TruA
MLIHPDANSPPSEEDQWVQFSITGDNFLRGQVRRLIGLCISLARGWLPEDYVDLVMRHSTVTRDLRSEKETLEKRRLGALQVSLNFRGDTEEL